MKYSIAIDEDVSNTPITIKSKFSRSFTHFMSTTLLEITEENLLRLNYVINQYGQEI
jgi:hypothetical protein